MDLERVVEENKGLVYKVASTFTTDVEYQKDLVQIGYMALIDAYKRFNSGFGYKFSTYAVYYIKGYMMRYMRKFTYNRMIRIPEHLYYKPEFQKYSYQINRFEASIERGEDLVVEDTLIAQDLTEERERVLSMQKILEELFETITVREQLVLELRFYEGFSLEKIAQKLNITKERARQIEKKALEKMKIRAVNLYGEDYKKLELF